MELRQERDETAMTSDPLTIGLTFLALILVSIVFFALQRLRPLRLFFEYTTLTRLYTRRHRAPDTTSRGLTRRTKVERS